MNGWQRQRPLNPGKTLSKDREWRGEVRRARAETSAPAPFRLVKKEGNISADPHLGAGVREGGRAVWKVKEWVVFQVESNFGQTPLTPL